MTEEVFFFYLKRTIIQKVDIYENKLFSIKTQEGDDKKQVS